MNYELRGSTLLDCKLQPASINMYFQLQSAFICFYRLTPSRLACCADYYSSSQLSE